MQTARILVHTRVELFKVKKCPKTRKIFQFFFEVTTKPKVLENLKRSWNLKSLKEHEPCV